MKSLLMIVVFLLCLSFRSFAQSSHQPAIISQLLHDNSKGKVQVIQDKRIDVFLSKMIEINAHKGTMPGYRIVIFKGSDNKALTNAQAIKAKFYSSFPDIEAYIKIAAPNVWVYVGDFRTITDALKMKGQLMPLFNTTRIVPAEININELK